MTQPRILELAALANAVANDYREALEGRRGYSDMVAACNTLLRATDALTSAIADVVSE